jgi:hypothetical protein
VKDKNKTEKLHYMKRENNPILNSKRNGKARNSANALKLMETQRAFW